jgi:outer membrane protein OmpA-like peptidoglycan-associated protein
LRIGTFARGTVELARKTALAVPAGSVVYGEGQATLQIVVDGRIVVIGEGPAAAVEQVKARAAMGPAPGFEASADVTVTGQGLGIRELQGVDLTNATPEVCTNAFARLMQNNVITFAVDSDVIDPKSAPLLESLIRVAVRCDSAKIEVSGHTDVTGDPAQNFALSQRRANSVRLYLIERGVLDDRITAQGFGSTRPIAPNNTPAGQAANRRIEFRVAS